MSEEDFKNTDTSTDTTSNDRDTSDRGDRGSTSRESERGDRQRGEHAERTGSVRDSIRKSIREARGEADDDDAGDDRDERSNRAEPLGRAAREAKEAAAEKRKSSKGRDPSQAGGTQPGADAASGASAQPVDVNSPPTSWTSDAKRTWQQLPDAARAMIHKRERDSAAGVEKLRASYQELDQALEPHMNTIRAHGHTPGAAVSRMFGWFDALSRDPVSGFQNLVKAFNAGPALLAHAQQQPQQAAYQQQNPPDPFQQYAQGVEQRFQNFERSIAQQEEQRGIASANAVIDQFKVGKPHFKNLRTKMAELISTGACPLNNGQVDLQGAYDMAMKLDPELYEQTITERINAEKKHASEAARKARYASSSLSPTSAGNGSIGGKGKKPGGKSVRESLLEAREELSS